MKKNDLLKVLGIFFIVFIVLSWMIPSGSFSSGKLVADSTSPLGLFDIFRYPVVTLSSSVFILYGLVVLLVGGLYGVLNKTGAYSKFVESVVNKNKGKGNIFVIFTIIFFAVLSSLTGLTLPLFVMVPFFVTVLLLLGYNKLTALASTFVAILVGNIGCTYGFNIDGYSNYFLGIGIHSEIIAKVILLIIVCFLLIMFVLKTNKDTNKVKEIKKATKKTTKKKDQVEVSETKKIDAPLYSTGAETKKSVVPMIVVICFAIVLCIVGMYNWEIAFGLNIFNNLHSAVTNVAIKEYPILSNILGTVEALGYWSNYELCIVILMATILIGWLYNLKLKDFFDGFVKGIKEILPVAFYMMIANIIFLLMNSSSDGGSIFASIANFFLSMSDKFNVIVMTLVSAVGGVFYNDFPYLLNALNTQLTTLYTDSSIYPVMAFVMQSMTGIVALIVPTSMILFGGLRYLGISFKEWFKYIWKYVLEIFIIALIMSLIIMAFV